VGSEDVGNGVTPNDLGDPDRGPNNLLNHPVIQSARQRASGGTDIRFTLDAERNRVYRVEFFSSQAPDPSGHGEGATYLGFVNVSVGSGSEPVTGTAQLPASAPVDWYVTAVASEQSGLGATSEFSPPVVVAPSPPPRVAGRHVFYNYSAFDGRSFDANAQDDAAVATDKRALLPGEVGSFANLTSYDKGINGVMVDISDLPLSNTPTLGDFAFRSGSNSDLTEWEAAPRPSDFDFRRGAGVDGTDRLSISWSTAVMRNTWLQVTVLANARTGLQRPDVFYFGNLVGECAGPPGPAMYVSPADWAATRSALGTTAAVTSRYDHNRDGQVSPTDLAIVRSNFQRDLAAPPTRSPPPAAAASRTGVGEELLGELTPGRYS
jgi:hypothetical protein